MLVAARHARQQSDNNNGTKMRKQSGNTHTQFHNTQSVEVKLKGYANGSSSSSNNNKKSQRKP